MNSRALGGLLLILVGFLLGWLWYRGYLNTWIGTATGALGSSPTKVPWTPGVSTGASTTGGVGGKVGVQAAGQALR